MPNYSLILDTKFKPFSYQELVAPVLAATQAHQTLEDAYSEMEQKAGMWEKIAITDPYVYDLYDRYTTDLDNSINRLMQYGLNTTSRRDLTNMRSRYSKDIVPIELAYKRREALAEEQRKALAQNPTMLYQRMARDISLGEFIKNPSLDYGSQYSGALLTQQVANAASNLAREAQESEAGRVRLKQLLPYQYERLRKAKFNSDEVKKAILNSKDANSILTDLVEQVIDTSGIRGWNNDTELQRAYEYARQGLYSAIGQDQYQMLTDQYNMQNQLAIDALNRTPPPSEEPRDINLDSRSYLHDSGVKAKYLEDLEALGEDNEIARKYTGDPKKAKINIVRMYEEYKKLFNKHVREQTNELYNTMANYDGNDPYLDNKEYIDAEAKRRAMRDITNKYGKYGVTAVISDSQYKTLKDLGYTSSSTTYSSLYDTLNKLAEQRNTYSVNLPNYEHPDKEIRSYLGYIDASGKSTESLVYKLNPDGSIGEGVSYDDLNLYDEKTNTSGRQVTDISYSAFNPKYIEVQLGNRERYLMDPNVLGGVVAKVIGDSQGMINDDNLNGASQSIATALYRLLNDYNPTAPESSSSAGK